MPVDNQNIESPQARLTARDPIIRDALTLASKGLYGIELLQGSLDTSIHIARIHKIQVIIAATITRLVGKLNAQVDASGNLKTALVVPAPVIIEGAFSEISISGGTVILYYSHELNALGTGQSN